MSSTSLTLASVQFSLYAGLPIFSFGMIGNLINMCLLLPTQLNSCSFLLCISSLFNLIALSFGLLPRVISLGLGIDASPASMLWCKTRLFMSYIGSLGSLTCICLASIDRFLISCRNVRWRTRSTLRTTKIAIAIATFIIVAHSVPYLLFYTITESKTATGNITTRCTIVDTGFVLYGNYVVRPILLSILPGTILIATGSLTYRNVTSITAVHLRDTFQRSLTAMLLLQIIVVVVPIIPFAAINIYQTATSSLVKTSDRLAQENLISNVSNITLYISYASNFYIYLICAPFYRRSFLRLILCSHDQNQHTNRVGSTREHLEMNIGSAAKHLPRSVPPTVN